MTGLQADFFKAGEEAHPSELLPGDRGLVLQDLSFLLCSMGMTCPREGVEDWVR